jgi:hypothetical protein
MSLEKEQKEKSPEQMNCLVRVKNLLPAQGVF